MQNHVDTSSGAGSHHDEAPLPCHRCYSVENHTELSEVYSIELEHDRHVPTLFSESTGFRTSVASTAEVKVDLCEAIDDKESDFNMTDHAILDVHRERLNFQAPALLNLDIGPVYHGSGSGRLSSEQLPTECLLQERQIASDDSLHFDLQSLDNGPVCLTEAVSSPLPYNPVPGQQMMDTDFATESLQNGVQIFGYRPNTLPANDIPLPNFNRIYYPGDSPQFYPRGTHKSKVSEVSHRLPVRRRRLSSSSRQSLSLKCENVIQRMEEYLRLKVYDNYELLTILRRLENTGITVFLEFADWAHCEKEKGERKTLRQRRLSRSIILQPPLIWIENGVLILNGIYRFTCNIDQWSGDQTYYQLQESNDSASVDTAEDESADNCGNLQTLDEDEKVYICAFEGDCKLKSKGFNKKSLCWRHFTSHLNFKITCFCKYTTNRDDSLFRHIETVHNYPLGRDARLVFRMFFEPYSHEPTDVAVKQP